MRGLWPGFEGLGLSNITGQAKCEGFGLAWAGLGFGLAWPGPGLLLHRAVHCTVTAYSCIL